MPNIKVTDDAARELSEAARWYEIEQAGLGERLIQEFKNALVLLQDKTPSFRLCQNVMSESKMRQKQASRSLAETATQGQATLVAYKNRRLPSVN